MPFHGGYGRRCLLAVFALLAALVVPAGAAATGSQVLVVPFDNVNREPRLSWMGEASSILIAAQLDAHGINAIPRVQRVRAFERLQLPAAAPLSRATVIRVGDIVGATEIVVGSVELEDEELIVRARLVRLDTGRMEPEIVDRGPLSDLFAIYERLAGRILPGDGARAAPTPAAAPPLEAFENYVKGLIAESFDARIDFLTAAVARHPAYDLARLGLWEAYTDQGSHAEALAAAASVRSGSPLFHQAQFLVGLSQLELARYDEAFDTLQELATARPSAAVYNNLGVVQMRRDASPAAGEPAYFFNKAAEADPDDPDYCFNLAYVYLRDRVMPAAIYWLRETVRRNPADGDAHFALAIALHGTGSLDEAARERALASQFSSQYEQWERQREGSELLPRGLERVKTDLETTLSDRLDSTKLDEALRDQREPWRFYLIRGRRLFDQERDREAIAELRQVTYLAPYHAEAHFLLGRLYLRTGRTSEAVDELRISLWAEESAAARVALAEAYLQEKDLDAARAEAQRGLLLDPLSEDARRLLHRIEQSGVR